jgi:hypothetical protein
MQYAARRKRDERVRRRWAVLAARDRAKAGIDGQWSEMEV